MSGLQMSATWGRCIAAEADVMTASLVSALSTFHPGVWGPVDFLHSQLGPSPGFKMVTMELPKRRKLRNCCCLPCYIHDHYELVSVNLRLLIYGWNIDSDFLWVRPEKQLLQT